MLILRSHRGQDSKIMKSKALGRMKKGLERVSGSSGQYSEGSIKGRLMARVNSLV